MRYDPIQMGHLLHKMISFGHQISLNFKHCPPENMNEFTQSPDLNTAVMIFWCFSVHRIWKALQAGW